MLIEGNLLIGLLIGVSIAIVLVVIIIRYAVKNGSQPSGSLLSITRRNRAPAEEADADAAADETAEAAPAEPAGDGLSLPDIEGLDGLPAGASQAGEKTPGEKKKGLDLTGMGAVAKDLMGNLFGRRKKKEAQKQDVKEIDDQLNQVLQESQNFGFDLSGASEIKAPELSTLSDSQSLRNIDKEIRNQQQQQAAEVHKPEPAPQQQSIEGLNPYLQGGSLLDLSPQQSEPARTQEPPRPQEQPKPDLSKQPIGPKPPEKGPENAFKGAEALGSANDLLSEIAAESVKEEFIDLSIMKDLKDVPIACDELEKDLTGILGQISTNVQVSGKKKKSA